MTQMASAGPEVGQKSDNMGVRQWDGAFGPCVLAAGLGLQ